MKTNINFRSTIKYSIHKSLMLLFILFLAVNSYAQSNGVVQFVYTSDLHYGIFRTFRGEQHVESSTVNQAMIRQMNALPIVAFPSDGGINAGKKVGSIDYMIITGDITNRQQTGIQSATASWAQFSADYLNDGITLKNKENQPIPFLLECGNHDVSNAIGFPKPMSPLTDATSMVNIYNRMMQPLTPKTTETYNFNTDKINYTRDIAGVHFMFVTMWPDSANRIWMEKDLANISLKTPVIILTHDEPECEAKQFTNPNGNHDINPTDKFENQVEERLKDGTTSKAGTIMEQRGLVAFLKAHKNIKAYFHGNTNSNEFYTYTGPDNDISLHVFRVDSPMKGDYSGNQAKDGKGDETKLSFQVISLNGDTKTLTVRECLWNTAGAASPIVWGQTSTIRLE
ncbi:MAG: metallophosphoesterase [Paludibacter sp.]|nr:metallophosphoesterase [Paludibacter sp.]